MPQFKLVPNPTFSARVPIPVPGSRPEKVLFTFKYRDRDQFKELMNRLEQMPDMEMMKEVASGWELVEPFDDEHLEIFIEHHIAGPRSVLQTYLDENGQARLGNS